MLVLSVRKEESAHENTMTEQIGFPFIWRYIHLSFSEQCDCSFAPGIMRQAQANLMLHASPLQTDNP